MDTLREDAGPGLHRVTASDPAAVAAELGGRLCRSSAELDHALAEAAAQVGPDGDPLEELARVARRWAKLTQVAERTRQRVVAGASQRLTSGALAVHPDTVRDRARRLEAARAELLEAERALAAHDASAPEPDRGPEPAAPVDEPSPSRTDELAARLRMRRNQALGVVLASFGLGLILLAVAVLPLWAALLIPFVASIWALRHLRPTERGERSDEVDSLSRLAEVGAFTDELFGARRAVQELEAEQARLDAARSRAEEELRLAEKAWGDLAGPGVDPRDVDEVVRRFDPGLGEAEHLAGEAVGVRATAAVLAGLAERWAAGWEALGLPVPPIDDGEAAVTAVAERRHQAIVLVGEAAGRAEEAAARVPSVPVVVVEAEEPDPTGSA